MMREHDKAISTMQEAIRIQPSDADAHLFLGQYLHWAGRGDEAINAINKSIRLNPKDRGRRRTVFYLGIAYFTARRYADAIAALTRHYSYSARRGLPILGFLAAAYAGTDQDEKARAVLKAYLDKKPAITLSSYPIIRNYERIEDKDRFATLLRKAGMPE